MKRYSGLELPPRKVEYMKYLLECGGTAKITEIASNFSLDPSTVTRAVSELKCQGFVAHEPYFGVMLTNYGREYAAFLVRRHRILGLIFSHYGLSSEEVCAEVSRFESFVSLDAVNRMCRAMGHPTTGICGTILHDSGCGGYPTDEPDRSLQAEKV